MSSLTFHLSSFSPELFHNHSQSEARHPSSTVTDKDKKSRRRTKSVSPDANREQFEKAMALCSVYLEAIGDFQLRVTVCNVTAFITGKVLASFLRAYERIEEVSLLRSAAGTAVGDYMFRICLTREGFQAVPDRINNRDKQMTVVVEGRRPRC